ncbi:MAG: tetratricopeptide repeat protein [Candidatus Omnitrophota bacterium]|nr:outer membrane protein assembly factor BamD [Candidatus Omnitrophota bacterium]MBU2528786.1 outer membrane protein assembly factor BamD [bacterium]MBU3929099.1 outer membrane protein assembly factor BamD [bacterium]MBU4123729.1 outer membrane protein assembly factor BamD [bacterium]
MKKIVFVLSVVFAVCLFFSAAAVKAEEPESVIKSPEKTAEKSEVKEDEKETGNIAEKAGLKEEEDEADDDDDADEDAAILYLKAQSLLENEITQKAEDEFKAIIKNYSLTWWAELSYVRLAGIEMKSGRNASAIELLNDFSGKYPESSLKEKADYSLCIAYVLNKDKESAKKTAQGFIKKYPDSKKIKEVKKLLKEL